MQVGGLRAQDVDCSLQSVGGVVDRPLEGPGRGGDGVPHVQIVAVAGNCQDFEKRRGDNDTEWSKAVVRKSRERTSSYSTQSIIQ